MDDNIAFISFLTLRCGGHDFKAIFGFPDFTNLGFKLYLNSQAPAFFYQHGYKIGIKPF